ncbi:MAG: DUF3040 domain-containing protein [Propioniciclava sp.]
MALSEQEQRRFEQLAADLAAEDPRLAHTLRGVSNGTLHRRRAAVAGIAFVVGVGALIAGMQFGWIISVIGFVVMFAATIVALSSWRRIDPSDEAADDADDHLIDQDKWRRGQDEGF